MSGAVPTHYAQALADAVFRPESGLDPRAAIEQLKQIEEMIGSSSDLQLVLNSPAVNKRRKAAVLSKLADQLGAHRLVRNFLLVVATHRRTAQWKEIEARFEEIVDERLGWVHAEITSAQELTAEQREEIERALGLTAWKIHPRELYSRAVADWRVFAPEWLPRNTTLRCGANWRVCAAGLKPSRRFRKNYGSNQSR